MHATDYSGHYFFNDLHCGDIWAVAQNPTQFLQQHTCMPDVTSQIEAAVARAVAATAHIVALIDKTEATPVCVCPFEPTATTL